MIKTKGIKDYVIDIGIAVVGTIILLVTAVFMLAISVIESVKKYR